MIHRSDVSTGGMVVVTKRCGLCEHTFDETMVADEFGESEVIGSPYAAHIAEVHPDWSSPFGPGQVAGPRAMGRLWGSIPQARLYYQRKAHPCSSP